MAFNSTSEAGGNGFVEKGEIVCMGVASACSVTNDANIQQVDLEGNSILYVN